MPQLYAPLTIKMNQAATLNVPPDTGHVWASNATPFDLAVSFVTKPSAPYVAGDGITYVYPPDWVDVVPARRSRLLAVPGSAGQVTPQGIAPLGGSGVVSFFPWAFDASFASNINNSSAGTLRAVSYARGEPTNGLGEGDAQRYDLQPQPRTLAALPSASKSWTGEWTPGAAGATLAPFPSDCGLPYSPRPWNGSNPVIVYLYSAQFTSNGFLGYGRVQVVETGGSGATHTVFHWSLAANVARPFTPAAPHPVSITPSNGASLLSLQLICDNLSNAGFQLTYDIALDVDSRNGYPVPAIGYGELLSASNLSSVLTGYY